MSYIYIYIYDISSLRVNVGLFHTHSLWLMTDHVCGKQKRGIATTINICHNLEILIFA